MKKIVLSVISITLSYFALAQAQSDKSLVERVTNLEAKNGAFKVQILMRGAANFYLEKTQEALKFSMEDFRIDVSGTISKNVYYWYRQSLNRSFDGSKSFDNAQPSLNVAGIGVKMNKFNLFMGRQFAAFGGYEYDYAPMNVYEYSEIINYSKTYFTGVELAYNLNANQQFKFQVANAYVASFEDTFGDVPLHIDKSPVPLQYTLNWNGAFFDGAYKTRWSATYASVGSRKENYFYAFGNEFTRGKFNMYADLYYSQEDIDSRTMMSEFSRSAHRSATTASNVDYIGVVARINYTIRPQWVLVLKGMYDTASTSQDAIVSNYGGASTKFEKGRYSKTFGYMGAVEYTPFKTPLRFFASYVGRSYKFTQKAKALNFSNYNTDRISIGILYRMPIF